MKKLIEQEQSSPLDFCLLDSSPEYRLSRFERLTLLGGQELEKAIHWVAQQFAQFSDQRPLMPLDLEACFEAAQFYTRSEIQDNPAAYFEAPEKMPAVEEFAVHGLADGNILDLRFKSPFQVKNPAYREQYEAFEENKYVYARLWKHDLPARSTVIAVHGWTMGDQRLNSLAFLPGVFYRLGMDVALIELPFHGRRKPAARGRGELFDHLFPSLDMARTNEALVQSIADLRALRMYLEFKGARNIGCMGMSLGAYISALWASFDQLRFCIPIVPLVEMAEVAWTFMSKDPSFKEYCKQGLSLDLLRSIYALHCPLTHQLAIDPKQVFMVAGIGDKLVPARQPKLLWQHWRTPTLRWMTGGHVAHFRKSKTFSEIEEFLRTLDCI